MTLWLGRVLEASARHGRLVLVAGLIAGVALPGLAQAMRPHLPVMVAALLFLSAFRIGPAAVLGQVRGAWRPLRDIAVLQLALPVAAALGFRMAGVAGAAPALAVVLMLAAPSFTGAPNFTILAGRDPAPAMQRLVFGTALFPLSAIPVLWLLHPVLPEAAGLGRAAGLLIVTILGAVGAGFAARAALLPQTTPDHLRRLDGLGVIALAVIVVGLMTGIGPLLQGDRAALLGWLALVFVANFGMQLGAFALLRGRNPDAVALSIIAGNRNIALFLVALPAGVMDQLLPFIGCYQLPMYLTPMLLARLHLR